MVIAFVGWWADCLGDRESLHVLFWFTCMQHLQHLEAVLLQMSTMHGKVSAKLIRPRKALGAVGPGADVGLLSGVGAHVCLEVVRAGEFALADLALKGAHSGVLAAVPAELVRSWEALSTSLMITDIWFLPSMFPDMHLEVGELQVALGAARVQANKRLPLLIGLSNRRHSWGHEGTMRSHATGWNDEGILVCGHGEMDRGCHIKLVWFRW